MGKIHDIFVALMQIINISVYSSSMYSTILYCLVAEWQLMWSRLNRNDYKQKIHNIKVLQITQVICTLWNERFEMNLIFKFILNPNGTFGEMSLLSQLCLLKGLYNNPHKSAIGVLKHYIYKYLWLNKNVFWKEIKKWYNKNNMKLKLLKLFIG